MQSRAAQGGREQAHGRTDGAVAAATGGGVWVQGQMRIARFKGEQIDVGEKAGKSFVETN